MAFVLPSLSERNLLRSVEEIAESARSAGKWQKNTKQNNLTNAQSAAQSLMPKNNFKSI
jgi:hypothetical protein